MYRPGLAPRRGERFGPADIDPHRRVEHPDVRVHEDRGDVEEEPLGGGVHRRPSVPSWRTADAVTILSPAMPPVLPFISIVVPIRNEEATIERLTRSLLDQDYPRDRYEILMADGGSSDRTRELLARVDSEARVVVLDNPGRTAPAALNVAISRAKGDIVTRVDGHSYVAPDYLSRIVAVMEETGESVVGGPVQMDADTPFRRALVEALYSRVGVGSVPYRTLRTRAHVESLQTGSFRKIRSRPRGPVRRVARRRRGSRHEHADPQGRVPAAARSRRSASGTCRGPTLAALWRQIYTVGLVKARILRKHPDIFKWKYVGPTVLVAALLAALVFAAVGTTPGPVVHFRRSTPGSSSRSRFRAFRVSAPGPRGCWRSSRCCTSGTVSGFSRERARSSSGARPVRRGRRERSPRSPRAARHPGRALGGRRRPFSARGPSIPPGSSACAKRPTSRPPFTRRSSLRAGPRSWASEVARRAGRPYARRRGSTTSSS